jgi:hypothetical protein
MTKFNTTIHLIFGLLLSACGTSPTATGTAQVPISSAELTGTYECFAIEGTNTSDMGSLTLNTDHTGTFGSSTIQWNYDVSTNLITFEGDESLRDGTYFSEGQTLSVNADADDHFTCVKTE